MYVLDIGFPLTPEIDGWKLAREFETVVLKRDAGSAGSGLGFRDLQFTFEHQREAEEVELQARTFLSAVGVQIGPEGGQAYISVYQETLLPPYNDMYFTRRKG
jgi:hypothetical protein